MLLLLIASFNKLVSRISLTRLSFAAVRRQSTVYSGTLLGVHFQSPRRNFGAGSMRNAPWAHWDRAEKCLRMHAVDSFWRFFARLIDESLLF